jgi:hypothetical protein
VVGFTTGSRGEVTREKEKKKERKKPVMREEMTMMMMMMMTMTMMIKDFITEDKRAKNSELCDDNGHFQFLFCC